MTQIEKLSKTQYGSLRKMMLQNGMKPGSIYPCLNGNRKPWPAFRRQAAQALGVPEDALFDKSGWPLQAEDSPVEGVQ